MEWLLIALVLRPEINWIYYRDNANLTKQNKD